MEKKSTVQQSLTGQCKDRLELALKYYSVFSALTGMALTDRQLQLLAFTAINGNISYPPIRKEFIEKFNSSSSTINNMVGVLKKLKVLIKDGDKVKVNPAIIIDFDKNLSLNILITHG